MTLEMDENRCVKTIRRLLALRRDVSEMDVERQYLYFRVILWKNPQKSSFLFVLSLVAADDGIRKEEEEN